MITIFTHTKPFKGHFGVIQYNAINSWRALSEDVEIIIYGDVDGADRIAEKVNANRIKNVSKSENGMPLLNYLFEHTEKIAINNILCYINADIILPPNLLDIVKLAYQKKKCLIVGNRWDLDIKQKINYSDSQWWRKLFDYAISAGDWHKKGGIDYFIFPKNLWGKMPDIYLGLPGSDNWLIWRARRRRIPIIDISSSVYAVHQNHDYSHLGEINKNGYAIGDKKKGLNNFLSGTETSHNRKMIPNGVSMNLKDATWYLSGDGKIKKKQSKDFINRNLGKLPMIFPEISFFLTIYKKLYRKYFL